MYLRCNLMPQRYVLGLMGFLGVANAYIMRACLSLAIVEMVRSPVVDNVNITDPDSCPYDDDVINNSSLPKENKYGSYDWSESMQGWILSAFYYGYIVTHIPGGLLSQKFGGKHTMGLGILSTALFTLITPAVADLGAIPFCILRLLMGLGEGTTFPAMSTMLAQWAPPFERSQLASLVFAGVQIGTVLSSFLSGFIIEYLGWPSVFYIWGAVGILWFIFWCLLCFNDPSSHPFITEEEKKYLQEEIGSTERSKDVGGTPWWAIFTSAPVWALIIAEFGHDFGLYTMVTYLPKYMGDVLHFKISENGVLSSLPYLVMWFVSLSLGWVADKLLTKKVLSLTNLRKVLGTIGAAGPALGIILASYAGCDRTAVTVYFTIGMGFMGFCYASLRVNALDLSPNFAGTLMALANGIGAISGMMAPTLVGHMVPNRTLMEWRVVFWMVFGVLNISNLLFIVCGSGDIQPWNAPQSNDVALS